jgi:hypothetical protein
MSTSHPAVARKTAGRRHARSKMQRRSRTAANLVAAITQPSITKCFEIFLDVQQIRRAK